MSTHASFTPIIFKRDHVNIGTLVEVAGELDQTWGFEAHLGLASRVGVDSLGDFFGHDETVFVKEELVESWGES